MSARTYTVGASRVLELPGHVELSITIKPHRNAHTAISVGLHDPHTAGDPFRPTLAWCMSSRGVVVLQDDAMGNEAFASLWVDDTSFCVAVAHVPAVLNFFGTLIRDARHAATTRASA